MTETDVSRRMQIAIQHHLAGRLAEAEVSYRQIIGDDPGCCHALHYLGVIALQTGRFAVAVELICQAVARAPDNPAFRSNLGEAYRLLGRLDEAVASFRQALDLRPDYPDALNNLGNALIALSQGDEAITCFQQALALQPSAANTHYNLGLALAEKGQFEGAISCLEQAVALNPDLAEAHHHLGGLRKAHGQLEEAIPSYRRVLALRPDSAEAHSNLGAVLQEAGRGDEAIACLQRALALQPDFAATHNNLGIVFQSRRQFAAAAACLQRALVLQPDFAAAHNNLGLVFKEQGQLEEALACFQRARALQPDLADVHYNLGLVFKEQRRLEEALACYGQALVLQPGFAKAHNNLGNVYRDMGRLDEALTRYRRALKLKPDLVEAHSNLVYTLWYEPGADAQAILAEHQHWAQSHAAPLARFIRPHSNDRSPTRRLRIGYVSPDFKDHCQAFFMVPLLEAHDREQLEVHAYSSVGTPDSITGRIRRQVDVWHDVAAMSDDELAGQIRADEIDILVDLTMHMAHNRALVFARKPAPIQVAWLAYPGTTGMSTVDYRLTDPYLDPPGQFDAWYSEKSIRLPDTFWCYDPLTTQPGVGPLPSLARGHVTFGCLNNYCKVNADALRLWARVLAAVQDSRLILLCPDGSHRQHTIDFLAAEGVMSERIEFVAPRPRLQYLELYHRIDLCLDTFPYNGHTTSLDSYWMGVPVVTLVGSTVVGRAGWSQLSNLRLIEFAARTPDEFVLAATRFARDLPLLCALRATLRERMQRSPLMDAPRFARAIEAAYRGMWRHWCRSEKAGAGLKA